MRSGQRSVHSARIANRRSSRRGSQTRGNFRRSVGAGEALRFLHSVERIHGGGSVNIQIKLRIRIINPERAGSKPVRRNQRAGKSIAPPSGWQSFHREAASARAGNENVVVL